MIIIIIMACCSLSSRVFDMKVADKNDEAICITRCHQGFVILFKVNISNFFFPFPGTDISVGEEVAIKLECVKTKHPQLHIESKIYKMMQGGGDVLAERERGDCSVPALSQREINTHTALIHDHQFGIFPGDATDTSFRFFSEIFAFSLVFRE